MLTFKWSRGLEDFDGARMIREQVFMKEQGFENEFDEIDKTALHVTGYENGEPVAVGRLFAEEGGVYHIGRIAVLKAFRGRRFGEALMREIISKAGTFGARKFILGAQCRAQDFYKKLGFSPYGDLFDDEGCPHVMMALTPNN